MKKLTIDDVIFTIGNEEKGKLLPYADDGEITFTNTQDEIVNFKFISINQAKERERTLLNSMLELMKIEFKMKEKPYYTDIYQRAGLKELA